MEWSKFFYVIGLGLAAWLAYRSIRYNRQAFSSSSLQKTLTTLGGLAIGLIAFIGILILLLRQG